MGLVQIFPLLRKNSIFKLLTILRRLETGIIKYQKFSTDSNTTDIANRDFYRNISFSCPSGYPDSHILPLFPVAVCSSMVFVSKLR